MKALAFSALALLSPAAPAQWTLQNHNDLLGVDDAEFTPDGRYLVIRDVTARLTAQVYEASSGNRLLDVRSTMGPFTGVCQDAVAVTNERAVVLGSSVLVLDLSSLALLSELDMGLEPRDVVFTPDGSLAAVRGGDALYVIELATGSIVLQAPGLPAQYTGSTFDVDSVAADDRHAVFTSEVGSGSNLRTRVTVVDLHPGGGGPPVVAFETTSLNDQFGKPHDLAMTPDGQHVAVRSDGEVGLYRLNRANSQRLWRKRLFGDPGPFGSSAMDSIEVTDYRIATLSRFSNGAVGAQLDVFGMDGEQRYARFDGDPHDLALTPDGRRLVLRTHLEAHLFDVRRLPNLAVLQPLDSLDFPGSHTSFGAGLDSIVATNDRVAAMSRTNAHTSVAVWDIGQDRLQTVYGSLEPDKALDVEISPGGRRAIFGFLTSFLVVDLRTGSAVLRGSGTSNNGWPTWCDGVAINGQHAAAFGVGVVNGEGWLALIDLFEQPQRYCPTTANSTGEAGELVVSGTDSVANNDLTLWGTRLPARALTRLVYGSQPEQVAFGDGFDCVGGQTAGFRFRHASISGVATEVIDYNNLPQGGGTILPGTTWYFQMLYRDPEAGASGINLTDALGVLFGN